MLIFARVPINGQGVKDKCAALNCVWSIKEGNLFPHRTTNHRLIIVVGIISAIRQFKVSFVLFGPFCMGGGYLSLFGHTQKSNYFLLGPRGRGHLEPGPLILNVGTQPQTPTPPPPLTHNHTYRRPALDNLKNNPNHGRPKNNPNQ